MSNSPGKHSNRRVIGQSRHRKNKMGKSSKRLTAIFAFITAVPVLAFLLFALTRVEAIQEDLKNVSVSSAFDALKDSTQLKLDTIAADRALSLADFLRMRNQDALMLAQFMPSNDAFRIFSENRNGPLQVRSDWTLSDDGTKWIELSSNALQYDGFSFSDNLLTDTVYTLVPLYDEITFIDLNGQELFKFVNPASNKRNHTLSTELQNISSNENTFANAENYWEMIQDLRPGEVFVSDVVGFSVSTIFDGMFTPGGLRDNVPVTHPEYSALIELSSLANESFIQIAREQAFSGAENPVGQRFEGIVRWVTPVVDFDGEIWGFITLALNHDHIMRFTESALPILGQDGVYSDAGTGNYAFMVDNNERIIAHPRHQYIAGIGAVSESDEHMNAPAVSTHGDVVLSTWSVPYITNSFLTENSNFAKITLSTSYSDFSGPATAIEKKLSDVFDHSATLNSGLLIFGAIITILVIIFAVGLVSSTILKNQRRPHQPIPPQRPTSNYPNNSQEL